MVTDTDRPAAGDSPAAGTGTPNNVITVKVLHGGFDAASYAVMVAVYGDEEMSGAERFLDDQFAQLLSGWRDLGRYPGRLGTSVFVEPEVDVDEGCRPIGAYLVGLGSALSVNRSVIAFAVRRALVDRCVRLYPPVSAARSRGKAEPQRTRVGVSTALLGVRDDEGVRVEDAVAGILEGVRETNRALERFEHDRQLTSTVRIAAVEIVERFVHRANLAATAVRRIRPSTGSSGDFVDLETVSVRSAASGLPLGAALIEKDRSWRRVVITEQASESSRVVSDPARPLVVSVSTLGRDARADRVTHRIDRASLDALTARLAANRHDRAVLDALRDRLVPHSLRSEFLTTEAIQLVVDEATANFPWELLVAPGLPSGSAVASGRGGEREPKGTGSILRLFTEIGGGRLRPERATVGTALVIGAGSVEGLPLLPGAVAEAKEVGRSLARLNGSSPVELLVDDDHDLDVAELNMKLLGDHQIVHLACHGIHVDGDRSATGAVLAGELRFTVDLVESMPVVPELVFVNSCHNARIDAIQPGQGVGVLAIDKAASLAQALMGIGVRAVIAAGWSVADEAAKTFAITFYEAVLDGRTLGDAVTNARASIAAQGATWAAYQCYGDPAFVLRGRPTGRTSSGHPVGLVDLKARLGALATQVADLSRPRPGALEGRRGRLLMAYRDLEKWVGESNDGVARDPEVWRLLGRAARELGEFSSAAHWYECFADSTGRPHRSHACAADLQQAANSVARAAQAAARAAQALQRQWDRATGGQQEDIAPESATAHEQLAEALARFPRAVALVEGSIEMCREDEGWAILASVHKKWATVDPDHREEHLRRAVTTYEKIKARKRGAYGVENRLQVVAVRDSAKAREIAQLMESDDQPGSPPLDQDRLVDAVRSQGLDFWGRVAFGDRALTDLMLADSDEERQCAREKLVRCYEEAFRGRSSFAERSSTIEHLQDLDAALLEGDERKPYLAAALNDLQPWNVFEPRPSALSSAVTEKPPAAAVNVPDGRSSASVELTAFHAACGDCLRLDYTGDDGRQRRLLVDGGLASAYDEGLSTMLGSPGQPTSVDVAVVTHVDADHIEGILRAFTEGRLAADDVWFNGRDQLVGLFPELGSRSTKQGDALSLLIPDVKRNSAVDGAAIVLSGASTVVPLPGGARAVLLSPSKEGLRRLLKKWPEPTEDRDASPLPGDVDVSELEAILEHGENELGDERGAGQFGTDNSVANGSSIAFLFEHGEVSVLLTGDASASVLTAAIKALIATRQVKRLAVDVFKLPHHGSRRNLTDELLELVDPRYVLVCTDGTKFQHPDEDAICKVREHYPGAEIIFTDWTPVTAARAGRVQGVRPSASPVVLRLGPVVRPTNP